MLAPQVLFAALIVLISSGAPSPAWEPPALAASPNPVPSGAGVGTTTITWSTGDGSSGVVQVAVDEGEEKAFARGSSGSAQAPWISDGRVFSFRLYSGDAGSRLLAQVEVAREPPVVEDPGARVPVNPVLAAHPNPIPAGLGTGATQIVWDVGDRPDGRVNVSIDGKPEMEFAVGPRGALYAQGIAAGSLHHYRLYSGGDPEPLASILVTRDDARRHVFWATAGASLLLGLALLRRGRARPRPASGR